MRDYLKEVVYFEKIVSNMKCSENYDEYRLYKSYLNQLLELNSIKEIVGYYNAIKKDNLILKEFEKEVAFILDLNELKTRLVFYFIELILKKENTN